MFSLRLSHEDHARQYSIVRAAGFGWEVQLIEDGQLSQHQHCQDWHRVEFTMAVFEREARALEALGWRRHDPEPGVAWRKH